MTALDLTVGFWAAGRDVLVLDAEVVKVPGEVGSELGAIVRPDRLDCDGQALPELDIDEVDRGANRVVVVDFEDSVARSFIDGGELVQTARRQFHVLTSTCTD